MDYFRRLTIKIKLSKYFYKSFFSSILVSAVVLLIIATVVYFSFINTLQSEIENSNISELSQLVNYMDTRFKEMDSIAVNVTSNNEFDYFNSTDESMNAYSMVKELVKYKSGNEFLYDIIYYSNYANANNKIISSFGEMSSDLFFKYIYKYDSWSKEEFLDLIKKMNMRKIRASEPVLLNNQVITNVITCIYPLPINATMPSKVLLFIIEQNTLDSLVKNILKDCTGYIYILDEKDNLIFGVSGDAASDDKLNMYNKINIQALKENVNTTIINGTNYSIVNLKSDYNRWRYVTVIKTDKFMSKVYARKSLFNYSVIIVIIIGTTIAFVLAINNYKPLKNLIQSISTKGGEAYGRQYFDDIEYIADVVNQIRDKNKFLLKEQFLQNLLHGRYSGIESINKNLSDTYLNFIYKDFIVCILFIDDFVHPLEDSTDMDMNIMFNIPEMIEEKVKQIDNIEGYIVKVEERSVALLLNFDRSDISENDINGILMDIKDLYKNHCSFTIGVGSICSGTENVRNSYSKAKKAVYYRLLKGKNNIISYNEIKESEYQAYKYPVNLESALIKAIKQPDIAGVEQVISELKGYISKQKIPIESIQCICFGVINSVIKIIDDMNLDASDCFIYEEDYLSIQNFDTVESMLDRLATFCSKICEYKIELKENKNVQLKSKIFEMVDGRLHDKTLSLESLAMECNLSPSYITRYFKQQTGESLMQYVDRQRMDEVKKLLKDSKMSLKDILNQVGYIDEANFIRKFKKQEGITPIKYRQIAQN